MRSNQPQSLEIIFNYDNGLHAIQQKAIALSKLNHAVMALLPNKLQHHCRVANYRQHKLVIEVENANWLMLLRYEQHYICNRLRADILPSLQEISMYINPYIASEKEKIKLETENNQAVLKTVNVMSPNTKNLLNLLAQKTSGKLKEKLKKLARHG